MGSGEAKIREILVASVEEVGRTEATAKRGATEWR